MTNHVHPETENAVVTLRERIHARYLTYHHRDRLRFPALECNTNRTNYLPLRESFEEEFFVLRGINRQQRTIHVPSTTTLSLLFTNDAYVPSAKILNTCWSYAEGSPAESFAPQLAEPDRLKARPINRYRWLLPGGAGLIAGLLIGLGVGRCQSDPDADRTRPERAGQAGVVFRKVTIIPPASKLTATNSTYP